MVVSMCHTKLSICTRQPNI
ncbi:hypothetical protein Zm00014a_007319 [Zea mays]|uniref:Uncharacterized protein n=1 Tax=Zea mays TaxID=4577 RepID=A0A3L6DAV9_MAIZE|nr:hypothetical protein Zm00014a_007319 [Zea mays]